jgi:precorrin-3B synthase
MSKASLVRGWCPGALRPMQTGDGLLVRLRITGGIVPARLARAIAEASLEFGNGLIDLSARANLQLRGVTEQTLPALTRRLRGLGLLDENPDAEAVRNVVASPLAGLDETAALDIRPLVGRLERRLAEDVDLHALPGKFGFAVDDGGIIGLDSVAADVRFRALPAQGDDGLVMISLAGTPEGGPVAFCPPDACPDAAARLALAFLRLREDPAGPARRMAPLVGRVGATRVLEGAGLMAEGRPPDLPKRAPAAMFDLPATLGGVAVAMAAPFGRWTSDDLWTLATLSENLGDGELRLTPYRAILLPVIASADAKELRDSWAVSFIVSADDARLAVAACPGAPACGNATTDTHADALALAGAARGLAATGLALHVSGCGKGCAHPGAAPVTLVGVDGAYDLVACGTAADRPARRGLSVGDVAAVLREWDMAGKDARP